MAKEIKRSEQKKSKPPSALLVFTNGFDGLPTVVPNGGSEEMDERLMRWLRQKLLGQPGRKKVA